MITLERTWDEFKSIIDSNPSLSLVKEETDGFYNLFVSDALFLHHVKLSKGSANANDYETNYLAQSSLVSQTKYSAAGHPIHQSTPRPQGTTTFFCGAGDNGGIAGGQKVTFKMTASDFEKSMDLSFIEDVHVKDGVILMEGAPLGATIDIELVHPIAGVVGAYLKKIPLLGTGRIDLNSEDQEILLAGMILRCTVRNSNQNTNEDAAAAFKVAGFFEMYRATTV
jgi:hypothetical protein